MLVRLLARLAARECLVVLSSSPAAANTSAASHLSLPFIPSIAETLEFCITTGYPFRHA